MDPISAFGLIASVAQTLSAVGELIKFINQVKKANMEKDRLAVEAADLVIFLTRFRSDIEQQNQKIHQYSGLDQVFGPGGPLDRLSDAVNRLVRKLRQTSRWKVFRSVTWPLEKQEVDEVVGLIESLKSLINLRLTADNFRLAANIDTGVTELKVRAEKEQQDREHRALLQWISPLDFSTRQGDYFSRRHDGTGTWFLEDGALGSWCDGPPRTLWCHGQPGSGKTILTSLAINWFSNKLDQDARVAYVYFNYKEEETQTSEKMIASLLEQLVRVSPILSPKLLAAYRQHQKLRTRPTLAEVSTLLQSELQRYSRSFIFVDALDECSRQNGNMDRFIAELSSLQRHAHLFVTSRFSPSPESRLKPELQMEIRASDADIKHYLNSRVRSEGRLGRLLANDADLQTTVVSQITSNAEGMFLLAQLQIDFLSQKTNRRDIRRALPSLPHQLPDVYSAALHRIRTQSPDDALLAERFLALIVLSKRPLTLLEAQHALAVEVDAYDNSNNNNNNTPDGSSSVFDKEGIPDEEILVSACAGLVAVDRQGGVCRLVHYTAQEYFETAFADRMGGFRVDMAAMCVAYLSLDAVKGVGGGGDGSGSGGGEVEEGRERLAFGEYAAQYWGDHARGEPEKVLRKRIARFCRDRERIAMWYQVEHRRRHGFEVDAAALEKVTGLHVAAGLGLAAVVEALLEVRDVDVNARDIHGETPLHWAAAKGYEDVVRVLLGKRDVVADVESLLGMTALSSAAEGGHMGVVRLLAERDDVALDAHDSVTGVTPLWRAADRGHDGVVQALLSSSNLKPVNVNAPDRHFCETPLSRAVKRGYVPVIQEILKRLDVDLNAVDTGYGDGALVLARKIGNEEVIRTLENHVELGSV
ncbi:hypothetical protein QBC33DRAFT_550345 [Phialemonium atrogriseum]|uniref:NACHT domain-containing protein n=1 Tax=Phialemonium atrogriseum TaxID=1093897 RepID=A0AAJ0FC10_9PEZI|nr:uncharacterized protein QBC33DRAFT_550345 [Phialemonium atrogriseum]KAK1763091.1 hypothetical protein QBC33DRAFT_550345 [Phialemonium atrogriseum]